MSTEFYITLPSNVKHENNTTSCYRTILSKNIELDGKWVVGISEAHLPFSWNNIGRNGENQIFIRTKGGTKHRFFIEKNYYENINELVLELENTVAKYIQKAYNADAEEYNFGDVEAGPVELIETTIEHIKKQVFEVEWNKTRQRVIMHFNHDNLLKILELPSSLIYTLGFAYKNGGQFSKKGSKIATFPPDMSGGLTSACIYCDIIEPVHFGDKLVKILQVLPLNTTMATYGKMIQFKFDKPQYVPVQCKTLSEIQILINDTANRPIEFNFGIALLKLHFKKIR